MEIAKRLPKTGLSISRVWDLRGPKIVFSIVYTLAMARLIHIQVRGHEAPLTIKADKVEEVGPQNERGTPRLLRITSGDEIIGEFKDAMVDGWWIQD
ncbi:MAG TPA: hypothetical protein VGG72_28045 [Bryobacteraceae bacterium]